MTDNKMSGPSSNITNKMFGPGNPSMGQGKEQLHLQVTSDILLRTRLTTLEGALSDRGRISALESALSVLGLGDDVTRVTNIGGPLHTS